MTTHRTSWPYWSVDIPGMNETEAQELLDIAKRAGIGDGGEPVDPTFFLTLHIDRDTVVAFLKVFGPVSTDRPPIKQEDKVIVSGILDVMREWLEIY